MLSNIKTKSHAQKPGWISELFTQNWLSGIKSDFELSDLISNRLVRHLFTRGLVGHLVDRGFNSCGSRPSHKVFGTWSKFPENVQKPHFSLFFFYSEPVKILSRSATGLSINTRVSIKINSVRSSYHQFHSAKWSEGNYPIEMTENCSD